MAQPWKFHSLAVAVSSKVQVAVVLAGDTASVLGLADVAALLSGVAAEFVPIGAALLGSTSVSPFRKNSASLPPMRLLKTRKDLPSGPTATSTGTPRTRSTTGDCLIRVSQG